MKSQSHINKTTACTYQMHLFKHPDSGLLTVGVDSQHLGFYNQFEGFKVLF